MHLCNERHASKCLSHDRFIIYVDDISQSPALGYMQIVNTRDSATPLPINNNHMAPGIIIHSDEWAAYNCIDSLPNVSSHSTVNHSVMFMDPATGTHTQNVQSYWNRCKTKFKMDERLC